MTKLPRLGDLDDLEDAVVHEHGAALAAHRVRAQLARRSGVGREHLVRVGVRVRVGLGLG